MTDDTPMRVIDPEDCSKTIIVAKGPCIALNEKGEEVGWIVKGQPQYVIMAKTRGRE